jgi:hypothetical protein
LPVAKTAKDFDIDRRAVKTHKICRFMIAAKQNAPTKKYFGCDLRAAKRF